jgi:hypothetical protein
LTFGVLAAVAASSPSSDDVTPGVLGFLVVAAMGVALVFLLRSMNKQFRKIAPKAEGATASDRATGSEGVTGAEGVTGSKPGQSETSAQEAPK